MGKELSGLVSHSAFGPRSFSSLLAIMAFCARVLSPSFQVMYPEERHRCF